jgi:exopolysaccharide biosynthesis polyprenyl glycosylphosphotransferase
LILDVENYAKGSKPFWLITLAGDLFCILFACVVSYFIIENLGIPLVTISSMITLMALYAGSTTIVYVVSGLYSSRRFKPFSFQVKRIIASNVIVFLFVMALYSLFLVNVEVRLTLSLFLIFTTILVIVERWIWDQLILVFRKKGYAMHQLVLIGNNQLACKFYDEAIRNNKNTNYGFVYKGYLAAECNENLPNYLGSIDMLKPMLQAGEVSEIVVIEKENDSDTLGVVVALGGHYGAKVSIVPEYSRYLPLKSNVDVVGDLKMITLRSSPNANPGWGILKRSMDIVGSITGIILSSPIMLVSAIMIKRNSPDGPILFKQQRCGRNGKPFNMYKLRTMVPNAEDQLESLIDRNEVEGPIFKIEEDPRIITGGAFLRKYSIDEIPQFLNVLLGSMSLVGPRPPLPKEVAEYKDWEWSRLSVKPGLTCYWQVSGRSNLDFDRWMQLDLKYVEEQSFFTDAKIILLTFGAVFSGRGAY